MIFWKRQSYNGQKSHQQFPQVKGGRREFITQGYKGLWGMMEIFYITTAVVVRSLYIFFQTHRTVYLK